MSRGSEIAEIREKGWTEVPFALVEADRAQYARLANTVIDIALEDEAVKESLAFEINPDHESGTVRTGMFGVGYPRNSADTKVYLHTGFQSRQRADAVLPERQQPVALQEFWNHNDAMLYDIHRTTVKTLKALGAGGLLPHIFPGDDSRTNVHLRTVRYTDSLNQPVGMEVVSGHADLGLATLHLYETHGGWFKGVPYPPELIRGEDSPERREAIRAMRSQLQLLEQKDHMVPFFLGANWQTYPFVPEGLRDLPACYHAGFRPLADTEVVSSYAGEVTGGKDDRVSVIAFMHPHGDMLKTGQYVPATVSNCRPEF